MMDNGKSIDDEPDLLGDDLSIARHARLVVHDEGVAYGRSGELFLARHAKFDGAARSHRAQRGEGIQHWLVLAPESTAHLVEDNTDSRDRDSQNTAEIGTYGKGTLGGDMDGELSKGIYLCHGVVCLD